MKKVLETTKKDIRQLSLSQLEAFFEEVGEKKFRARQVYEWLWKKSAHHFETMTNLSLPLRKLLAEHFEIRALTIHQKQISGDGTLKFAFQLYDGHLIEGVLIPADDRMTACVSSQVGCSLTCKFCATGYMKRMRNLTPAEIYDQVVLIRQQALQHYNLPLSNIVFMGMGEPLLNYQNVMQGIEHLTSPEGLQMAAKRIIVSTAGIAKMIKKMGDEGQKCNLALSLHAADDEKRKEIMPINESNTLEALAEALRYYYQKTKKQVTFEYIVFHHFNDTLQDAEALYRFTKHVPSKVNIIEYNPIEEADFTNTAEDKLAAFARYLEQKGVVVKVRRSRGKDIDAACGQLAVKET
ncbi:MAG: 23S rRNA (adenine(2503)-C(2))-methyltransferase RlmN [Thermonemataceae bacterium]